MRRRQLLSAAPALVLAGALGGCSGLGTGASAPRADAPDERVVELSSGRALSTAQLLDVLRHSDYVLLGELHDNPRHHALRGQLLAGLGAAASVVAEHLPRGRRVTFGPVLLDSLQQAGFDPEAWGWPVHEPLFAGVARAGLPLQGGDIDRASVQRVAREGERALPADLAALLQPVPLSAAAQAALDDDLSGSHCGMLPASRLPAMRWAQAARDASLWSALRASGGRPAVLLAGNGHVRLDYGVPRLIAAWQPGARVASVGFVESGTHDLRGRYTHAWITPARDRDDPCAAFAAPAR